MTVALEQNAVSLEAPAAAFLASVSEPDAIRILLIEEGSFRGSLTDELSKQGFAVRTVIVAGALPPAMPTSSSSIVTG